MIFLLAVVLNAAESQYTYIASPAKVLQLLCQLLKHILHLLWITKPVFSKGQIHKTFEILTVIQSCIQAHTILVRLLYNTKLNFLQIWSTYKESHGSINLPVLTQIY